MVAMSRPATSLGAKLHIGGKKHPEHHVALDPRVMKTTELKTELKIEHNGANAGPLNLNNPHDRTMREINPLALGFASQPLNKLCVST